MDIKNTLLLELLVGLVYGVLGFVLYKGMEKEAKRRGVLDASVV
jgi:hypothetical protein